MDWRKLQKRFAWIQAKDTQKLLEKYFCYLLVHYTLCYETRNLPFRVVWDSS